MASLRLRFTKAADMGITRTQYDLHTHTKGSMTYGTRAKPVQILRLAWLLRQQHQNTSPLAAARKKSEIRLNLETVRGRSREEAGSRKPPRPDAIVRIFGQ